MKKSNKTPVISCIAFYLLAKSFKVMSKQVKFGFFLKSRLNSKNEHPIVMSIILGYDRTKYFTEKWIKKKRWNEKTNKIRGHDQESISMNDSLLSLQSLGRQVTNELIMSGKPFKS